MRSAMGNIGAALSGKFSSGDSSCVARQGLFSFKKKCVFIIVTTTNKYNYTMVCLNTEYLFRD